jgi:Cu-Zn family superoxide dismutase
MTWPNIEAALATFATALAVSGCVSVDNSAQAVVASASLVRGDDATIGSARLMPTLTGMTLAVEAAGLPPGLHGIHVHAAGRCDPPDFATALGHWNPGGRAHGPANPAGAHAGDLPNLLIGADGRGSAQFRLDAAAGPGLDALFDADGAALVIHAGADDMRTDPSGNSGGRIACGVFVRR